MFERPENASDETIIELDADKKAASIKAAADAYHSLYFLHELIGKDKLSIAMRFSCIGVAEAHINRLKLLLGSKSDEEQEAELNANLLRQANIENHRLREEMGKSVSLEVLGLALYPLQQEVYEWWQKLGFSFMEGEFKGWSSGASLYARLSCYLDKHASCIEEDQPVTAVAKKRKRIDELALLVDIDTPRNDDPRVMDTPRSREWIVSQILERFPGTRVSEWKSHGVRDRAEGSLRDISVVIPIQSIREPVAAVAADAAPA